VNSPSTTLGLTPALPGRGHRIVYSAPRERGGEAVEQAVSKALQAVGRGASLRGASVAEGAPFASLQKAWKALEGDTKGPAWKSFVAALPPAPAPAAAPSPAVADGESPLGPRLKRKADRHGDAVPYGKHGEWGMYREGTKEMTTKISEGTISAEDAQQELAAAGVHVTAQSLGKRAKCAPGESPAKAGARGLLDWNLQQEVHKEIKVLREHDLPVTKSMVKCMVLSKLTDEEQDELFPKGITSKVYYGFLDNFDLNTEQTKPLESDRDLWLTSTVRMPAAACHTRAARAKSRSPLVSPYSSPHVRFALVCRMPRSSMRSGRTWRSRTAWRSKIRILIRTSRTMR
jgi:hypothetical protein